MPKITRQFRSFVPHLTYTTSTPHLYTSSTSPYYTVPVLGVEADRDEPACALRHARDTCVLAVPAECVLHPGREGHVRGECVFY